MARTASITQEQVNLAAEQLRNEGKTPGVRNVRELLGMGSNQTVQAMLATWYKARPEPQLPAAEDEELPAELVHVLKSVIAGAKRGVSSEYEEAVRSAFAVRDSAVQDALGQYKELEELRSSFEYQSKENTALAAKAKELQKQVDSLHESEEQRGKAENRAAAAEAKVALLEPLTAKLEEAAKAAKEAAAAHEAAMKAQAAEHAQALASARAEAQKLHEQGEKTANAVRELEKALHTEQARSTELAKQGERLQADAAQKAAAEQRAAIAETKAEMLKPRADLADQLQARVAVLEAQAAERVKPDEKSPQKAGEAG